MRDTRNSSWKFQRTRRRAYFKRELQFPAFASFYRSRNYTKPLWYREYVTRIDLENECGARDTRHFECRVSSNEITLEPPPLSPSRDQRCVSLRGPRALDAFDRSSPIYLYSNERPHLVPLAVSHSPRARKKYEIPVVGRHALPGVPRHSVNFFAP